MSRGKALFGPFLSILYQCCCWRAVGSKSAIIAIFDQYGESIDYNDRLRDSYPFAFVIYHAP